MQGMAIKRRRMEMRLVCVIMTAILLVAVPLTVWSQSAPDAVDVYKTRCAACHGAKGEGLLGGKIPALKGIPMTAEKIVALLSKGEGGKTVHATPIVNINNAEFKALADYVKSLK
jgi:mono/diheme cytochrome c family protein